MTDQDYTPPADDLDYEAVIREAENRRPDIGNWAADVRRELSSSNYRWVVQRLQEQHRAILRAESINDAMFLAKEFQIDDAEIIALLDNPEFGGGTLDAITGIVNTRHREWQEAARNAVAVIQKLDKWGHLSPNDSDACYELVQLVEALPKEEL